MASSRVVAVSPPVPSMHARTGPDFGARMPRRAQSRVTTIAVVGLGYVGLPLSILAASKGYRVIGFDIDEVKVAQLERREASFLREDEATAFAEANTLSVTARQRDIEGADVYIICVPTPVHENHLPDLAPLIGASRIVGGALREGALVIVESTVNPGVCEEVSLREIERASGLIGGSDFSFAHAPERIDPGSRDFSVRNIPRVMGGLDARSLQRAQELYHSILDARIFPMRSIKEAEAVKMVENSFRDVNIAFVNELAIAFDKAGIDAVRVIEGAATKPFGFMAHYPGCGVGGHCIPVDPYYLIRYGRQNGFEHRFLAMARRINNDMPHYAVKVLADLLHERNRNLRGARIALLGLAYKRDVPDMRESPALVIRDTLARRGAKVATFDPYFPGFSSARTLEDALAGADAALIATDHRMFRELTPAQLEVAGVDTIVDGRNCLPPDIFRAAGILYRGIGRG